MTRGHRTLRPKLLAVDLDGTLLGPGGVVHDADAAAIARLRDAGVPTTIVTGRMFSGSRPAADAAGILGPIACVDGSHIVDVASGVALHCESIVAEHAAELRGVLDRHGPASFVFARETIVHDDAGEPFVPYVRTWSPNVDRVGRVVDHPCWEHEAGILAVVALGPEASVLAAVEELRDRLAHAAFVVTFAVGRVPGMHAMLVRAAGATKGTAIAWLAEHHGITPADVVAVGDWLNDVPMFEVAGRSFAMGQAPPVVKDKATDHLEASAHDGGGVAEAIARVWGV
jgi:hypothetical protein